MLEDHSFPDAVELRPAAPHPGSESDPIAQAVAEFEDPRPDVETLNKRVSAVEAKTDKGSELARRWAQSQARSHKAHWESLAICVEIYEEARRDPEPFRIVCAARRVAIARPDLVGDELAFLAVRLVFRLLEGDRRLERNLRTQYAQWANAVAYVGSQSEVRDISDPATPIAPIAEAKLAEIGGTQKASTAYKAERKPEIGDQIERLKSRQRRIVEFLGEPKVSIEPNPIFEGRARIDEGVLCLVVHRVYPDARSDLLRAIEMEPETVMSFLDRFLSAATRVEAEQDKRRTAKSKRRAARKHVAEGSRADIGQHEAEQEETAGRRAA